MFFCHPELVSGSKTRGFVFTVNKKEAVQKVLAAFFVYVIKKLYLAGK